MRGARAPPPRPPPSRGIIPAGAGSTSSRRSRTSRPRGSSPQVRGAHPPGAPVVAQGGIIPAGAGSTLISAGYEKTPGDHPRRCGEHQASAVSSQVAAGSSPQVRGARDALPREGGRRGIIPAGAGSTFQACCVPFQGQDHPRRCGEHDLSVAGRTSDVGSSPQVRGARDRPDRPRRQRGIIPAGAGST